MPKIQFWQNSNIFTSFSLKFFCQFFSWNQSCQQLRSPKPHHNIFTSFSPKFFVTISLVKSKLSTAKKSKTTTFSRIFHQKMNNFLDKSKLNFGSKNEDFEQCVNVELTMIYSSKLMMTSTLIPPTLAFVCMHRQVCLIAYLFRKQCLTNCFLSWFLPLSPHSFFLLYSLAWDRLSSSVLEISTCMWRCTTFFFSLQMIKDDLGETWQKPSYPSIFFQKSVYFSCCCGF